jgi:hypothetical protein
VIDKCCVIICETYFKIYFYVNKIKETILLKSNVFFVYNKNYLLYRCQNSLERRLSTVNMCMYFTLTVACVNDVSVMYIGFPHFISVVRTSNCILIHLNIIIPECVIITLQVREYSDI